MDLVPPAAAHIDSYLAALLAGWSPDTSRPEVAGTDAARLVADPVAFLASMDHRRVLDAPVTLPDGSTTARLPGFRLWMWDGEFCGSIGLRWRPGTVELPATCLGHVGYTVVPWKRRRGYATAALAAILPRAWELGLPYVELTTDPGNLASQRVIAANGGQPAGRFVKDPALGGGQALRFRIPAPATGPDLPGVAR